MKAISVIVAMTATVIVYVALTQALTSPELTARYTARQQAEQVRARQQGETARRWAETWETWGEYGFPALAFIACAGVGGWAVVEWQRNRTKRHEVTEDHTTQRHLITAKKDIVLAYIAQCGDPGAYAGQLDGMRGVFLPASNEFVPIEICRAELAATQSTALARRQPPTINVTPVQQERRFLVMGKMEQEDW
jgi:hypothetical protein